jgi:hypothetical protein
MVRRSVCARLTVPPALEKIRRGIHRHVRARIPICGASMNPARSLAPALVSGQLQHLWIYLIAPIAGASVAVFACRCVREGDCCRSRSPHTIGNANAAELPVRLRRVTEL